MVPSNRCSCVDRQWAQLMRPIPIMSTETLASCAETRHAGAAKTSTAIKTRFIMRQIRAVATNQAAAGRTVIRAAINSASGGTSAHTTAGRAAPTPPPKAPGPVATPSPGASDHLHRADANPRGSTEISRPTRNFAGSTQSQSHARWCSVRSGRLQLPPPALVPLCTRPITFTLSSAPLCPLPRPAESRNTLTSRAIRRRRFSAHVAAACAPMRRRRSHRKRSCQRLCRYRKRLRQ